jgi:heat shock protein HslJ
MRTVLSILSFVIISFFVACNGDDQQNGTDQNAPNTLESLLNPNANSATPSTSTNAMTSGSKGVNDIWVLAGVNSKEKYEVNLVNNTPMLTVDSIKSNITGHTGCNSIEGKIKIQGDKLVFNNVKLTSNQPCSDKGFEKKLLSSLKSGPLSYKIANDTMSLNVGGGAEFLFRRIRRN